jgi:hypothetical protein
VGVGVGGGGGGLLRVCGSLYHGNCMINKDLIEFLSRKQLLLLIVC